MNTVRRTEVAGTAEVPPRHKQEIIFLCTAAECRIVRLKCLRKEIECPLRAHTGKAECRQAVIEEYGILCIGTEIGGFPGTACDDELPERGRIDVCENTRCPRNRAIDAREVRRRIRHNDIADALPGQGEGLAVGIADNRIVVKERNAGDEGTVIDDLTIWLICDDEDRAPVLLLLRAKEIGKAADRCLTVDCTARIVRRVDNDRLGPWGHCPLKCRKVNLKIVRLGRDDDELAAARLDKDAILREEWRKGDELVPRLGECLERDRHRCRRACRHKQIFPRDLHAEAALQIGGKHLAHGRLSRCNRVAVHLGWVAVHENVDRRIPNKVRRRHIRIAKAEIKDIFRADLCRTLLSKLKNRANRGLFRPEHIHFL